MQNHIQKYLNTENAVEIQINECVRLCQTVTRPLSAKTLPKKGSKMQKVPSLFAPKASYGPKRQNQLKGVACDDACKGPANPLTPPSACCLTRCCRPALPMLCCRPCDGKRPKQAVALAHVGAHTLGWLLCTFVTCCFCQCRLRHTGAPGCTRCSAEKYSRPLLRHCSG